MGRRLDDDELAAIAVWLRLHQPTRCPLRVAWRSLPSAEELASVVLLEPRCGRPSRLDTNSVFAAYREYVGGKSQAEVAAQYGIGQCALSHRFKALGLECRPKGRKAA